MLREGNRGIVEGIYGPLSQILSGFEGFSQLLAEEFKEQDITALKENLYTIDLWVWRDALAWFGEHHVSLSKIYSDMSIIGLAALLRETLFGMLMVLTYAKKMHQEVDAHLLWLLKKIYCINVLQVTEDTMVAMSDMIDSLLIRYEPLLAPWVVVDENGKYLEFGLHNWLVYCEGKDENQITTGVMGEDVIWFRGYLKTVTYYNKRYFIPR